MSPETFLHEGDRLRLVTYEEAFEICGDPVRIFTNTRYFKFPESGRYPVTGKRYELELREEFLRSFGGKVFTIQRKGNSFVGPHIHYKVASDEDIPGLDGMMFCPTMFSGYENDEFERDPLDETYAEDLFGFLFN